MKVTKVVRSGDQVTFTLSDGSTVRLYGVVRFARLLSSVHDIDVLPNSACSPVPNAEQADSPAVATNDGGAPFSS